MPTLFITGNSTAKNGDGNGWGSHLQKFFDKEKLLVDNRARAGRSSRTFITEGLWKGIIDDLEEGDYVLIQFGHNDAGVINDNRRARGSIPSLGEETQEIDNLVTGKHEVVHTFGWYMRNMIADQYELLGPIRVRELFPVDHTHTSPDGAFLNAAIVVSGLKAIDSPLAAMLSEVGQSVTAYAPNVMVEQFMKWMTAKWMPEAQPASDSTKPTLYAIGNSTVRTGVHGNGENGQWGWGAPIADFFDRTQLNVENRAWGGTSSRTFRTQGFWQKVLPRLKAGDFVIMQFGHNDSSPINDDRRARGTIQGNGEETQDIDNMLTGEHEIVHSYGWYIRQFIKEIKAKGATPIVCSLIPRNRWTDGKVIRSVDGYGLWAEQAATAEGAFFIDLNKQISDHYDSVGQEIVAALYFDEGDNTHTNAVGAQINAKRLVEGIKALEGCPLAEYLKAVEPR